MMILGRVVVPSAAALTAKTSLQPTATDYRDSPTDSSTVTIAGYSVVQGAVGARLRLSTPPGCYVLQFRAIGNNPAAAVPVGVYVDGVYKQSLYVPVGETILRGLDVILDGNRHIVELWLPYQQFTIADLVYSVTGRGIQVISSAVVTRRIAIYGDSIPCGALSDPSIQLGWPYQLRQQSNVSFALETDGGRSLWDDSGSGAGQQGFANHTLLADRLANDLIDATIGDVYIEIGVNDVPGAHFTSVQFGSEYSDLLDKIHARIPSAIIYCQTMGITTTLEGSAPAYRAAIGTAVSGRSYCILIIGPNLYSVGNLADALHPNGIGHTQAATALFPLLSLS